MIVKPMKAVMPQVDRIKKVSALPYDVYSRAEAREIVNANPDSYLSIERPDANFPDEVGSYDDCVYQSAVDLLNQRIENGEYVVIDEPKFYLYRQIKDGRTQVGVVAKCGLEDYLQGKIKKHELTREDKEADRVRNILETGAQTGLLFLAFKNDPVILKIIDKNLKQEPLVTFTAIDGVEQTIFEVSAEDTPALEAAFDALDALYIADGHHRAKAASTVYEKKKNGEIDFSDEADYVMAVIFPEQDLAIMDYNRVVRDLNGMTEEEFLDALKKVGTVEAAEGIYHPEQKGCFGIYLNNQWYKLCLKADPDADVVASLDCAVLQAKVLQPILGIENPRTDQRIDFIGGIRGLKEIERRCHEDMKVGFSLYPTQMTELFDVADAGLLMPPKSTWFEPKLQSGIFTRIIK